MIDYFNKPGVKLAYVTEYSINRTEDVLDLIGEVFGNNCGRVIINKELLPESFFSLKTGFAGEVLQKFSNYGVKLAIIGDFESIKSKSLAAFIYESNKGTQIFFKKTFDEAANALINV
jgi:hypothetical protein